VPSDSSQPDAGTTLAILALLRGQVPRDEVSPDTAYASLMQIECGGYLRDLWKQAGRFDSLPRGWAVALERIYRKTAVDTLSALADFRAISRLFDHERVPFILLKGSAYLSDLYDELGQRPLTDIDLLVRPADAIRMYNRLKEAGYSTLQWDDDYRRFEVIAPGTGRCSFEVHWRLGLPERGIDQDEVWKRSCAAVLEEVPCRRLAREDALLFHVAHHADHFFEPSLKWVVDLRLMLRRWILDPDSLLAQAGGWRVRTALCLAVLYLEKLFPGETPAGLRGRLSLGRLRRWLLDPFLDPEPLGMMRVGNGRLARYSAACILLDRPVDALQGLTRALRRPFLRRFGQSRRDGAPPPLWH